jgi:hypothetical protein
VMRYILFLCLLYEITPNISAGSRLLLCENTSSLPVVFARRMHIYACYMIHMRLLLHVHTCAPVRPEPCEITRFQYQFPLH